MAAITAFSFSSSPEVELYRQATVGPWMFLAPSYSPHWKPLRSYVNIAALQASGPVGSDWILHW